MISRNIGHAKMLLVSYRCSAGASFVRLPKTRYAQRVVDDFFFPMTDEA
jgi:hypothetical protein